MSLTDQQLEDLRAEYRWHRFHLPAWKSQGDLPYGDGLPQGMTLYVPQFQGITYDSLKLMNVEFEGSPMNGEQFIDLVWGTFIDMFWLVFLIERGVRGNHPQYADHEVDVLDENGDPTGETQLASERETAILQERATTLNNVLGVT